MRPADRFVELYNQLCERLAEIAGKSARTPFSDLLSEAALLNRLVQREAGLLRKYGYLRNAIVHDGGYPREIIAEPTEETLERFAEIVQRLVSPKLLGDLCHQPSLFAPSDRLAAALRHMREHDFSQVVVREGSRISLLTAEGVAKWLESQVEQDLISIADTSIADALACDLPGSFRLMARDDTLDAAQAAFATAIERGSPRLFAIIVTQRGLPHEAPLGIVTPWDVIER